MSGSEITDFCFVWFLGVNHVTLLGRVGQDPEVRGTVENPVTVFSLATSFTLKTRSGKGFQCGFELLDLLCCLTVQIIK